MGRFEVGDFKVGDKVKIINIDQERYDCSFGPGYDPSMGETIGKVGKIEGFWDYGGAWADVRFESGTKWTYLFESIKKVNNNLDFVLDHLR